jgi:predicted acyl esterase
VAKPSNWLVDHELGATSTRSPQAFFPGLPTSPTISDSYESTWLPRGFAVVHSESPGTGRSDGCPSSGGPTETLGATAVIDWLNGRRTAYSSRNGTLAIAAAATGVEGLAAIVPVSAISDWYDYYRANGLVRAPHAEPGGTGVNAFQGEDLDVIASAVYTRRDERRPRRICRPAIDALKARVARESGDRTAIWQERAYDLAKIKAATLLAHGGEDFNVMTEQAAQLYAARALQGSRGSRPGCRRSPGRRIAAPSR